MSNNFCVAGCLRLELDENGEMLMEMAEQLEEQIEDRNFVTAEQLQRLETDIGLFAGDFDTFQSECGRCTNFKSDGKVGQYQEILDKVKTLASNLNKLSTDKKEMKEGESCESK